MVKEEELSGELRIEFDKLITEHMEAAQLEISNLQIKYMDELSTKVQALAAKHNEQISISISGLIANEAQIATSMLFNKMFYLDNAIPEDMIEKYYSDAIAMSISIIGQRLNRLNTLRKNGTIKEIESTMKEGEVVNLDLVEELVTMNVSNKILH